MTDTPDTPAEPEPVAYMFWNEPDTQRHLSIMPPGSYWTKTEPLYSADRLAEREAWAVKIIEFFVQHGMLDSCNDYSLDDVMGALQDNYEPSALAERTDDLTFMQEANAALREDTARALAAARDAHLSIVGEYETRATTAEAALDSARKVIERIAAQENFDLPPRVNADAGWRQCIARMDAARQWLSANQKETKG